MTKKKRHEFEEEEVEGEGMTPLMRDGDKLLDGGGDDTQDDGDCRPQQNDRDDGDGDGDDDNLG